MHIRTLLSPVVYPTVGSDRRQRAARVDHCPADCCAKTSTSGELKETTDSLCLAIRCHTDFCTGTCDKIFPREIIRIGALKLFSDGFLALEILNWSYQ